MFYKLLGIISLSSLPFLFSLQGDFVFDDSEAIIKNQNVFSNSWSDCFFNDFWGTNIKSNFSHKSYRPLTILSFRLNYIFSGNQLFSTHFKITNLFCHVTSCLLVWIAFANILKGINFKTKRHIDIAYLSAVLFAVHPIHVEAVCGAVGRADLLAAINFFVAFLFYNKAITKTKLITVIFYLTATVVFATISMLFKENGITVLGFCLLYEVVINFAQSIHKRKGNNKMNNNRTSSYNVIRIILLIISTIFILYGRWSIMGGIKPEFKLTDNPAAFSNNFFMKVATYNYIYFMNVLLLVWPLWLCYDWSMGCIPLIETVLDFRILFIVFIYLYAILIIRAIYRNKEESHKKLIILAVSLSVIPFLPAANIFYPVGFVIAERILYIPSAGYCLIITLGLHKIVNNTKKYKTGITFHYFLILILALRSYKRSFDWQNEYKLFTSGLSVCPLNAKVHYNIAKVADANHQFSLALMEYKEAIQLYPEYYQAMNNLANLLKNQKLYEEAEFYLKHAIKHKNLQHTPSPSQERLGYVGLLFNKTPALFVLGALSRDSGITHETHRTPLPLRCSIYRGGKEINHKAPPATSQCHDSADHMHCPPRSSVLIGRDPEGFIVASYYRRDFPAAWMNLGIVLSHKKRYKESEDAYKTALKYRRKYPDCFYNLGNLYLEMNKTKEAIENWSQAINMNSSHVLAWANLLALLDNTGQIEKALQIVPRALAEVPDAAAINFAIANLYGKIDRYEEAEKYFKKAITLFGNRVQAIHYTNLGVLYHRWKKYSLAEKMYLTALSINSSLKSAQNNLKKLREIMK